jgi:hypothetical protein
MKPRLCVGNDSDSDKVRKAVRGLKVMARLGKRAQAALDELERDGQCPRGVAWLERYDGSYLEDGLESLRVRTSAGLFRCRDVTREDLPGWGDLRLEFGPLDEDERPNGQTFRFFPVYFVGRGLACDVSDDEPGAVKEIVHRPGKFTSEVGQARIKRGGSVTFKPKHAVDDNVVRIYRDPEASEKAKESAERFARAVADLLVSVATYRWEEDAVPQWLLDLNREVPGWLLEDGYVRRWSEQILVWAKNVRVVSEVMES